MMFDDAKFKTQLILTTERKRERDSSSSIFFLTTYNAKKFQDQRFNLSCAFYSNLIFARICNRSSCLLSVFI